MLVAERRAHDDFTASLVAGATHEAFVSDPHVSDGARPLAERQFNDRLSTYRDAFRARTTEPVATRLARVLVVFAGALRLTRGPGLAIVAELLARSVARIEAEFERVLDVTSNAPG